MNDIEDNYWWYLGLRHLVFLVLDRLPKTSDSPRLLDAGCGTGGILSRYENGNSYGFDYSLDALSFCKSKHVERLVCASITDIPYEDDCFDVVTSLDVISCLGLDQHDQTYAELHRVLKPGGHLILNLPAYNFLKSNHDRAIHTSHRYTARRLSARLSKAGFVVETMTYRNLLLFIPIALVRIAQKMFDHSEEVPASDLKELPPRINSLLAKLLYFENTLLSRTNLPFGLSCFCVASKPKEMMWHTTKNSPTEYASNSKTDRPLTL